MNKAETEISLAQEKLITDMQEWQATFDNVHDAIWILSHDQRILCANRTAGEFFHLPVAEMIGKHCWEIAHGTENPIKRCPGMRAQNSHTREKMELKIGDRWFLATVDPILDANHRYAGATHIVRDITERKQVERALRQSEYKYHALFEKMLIACALHEIICDTNGKPVDFRYLDVNPAFEIITGFKAVNIVGKTALEIRPDIEPFLLKTYGRVALTGEPITFDYYLPKTDRHLVITAYQPEEKQFACVFQDVTEQKRAEKALLESEQKFRILAENPIVGLFITQDRKFIYVNDRLAEMHGYSKEEIIGQPFYILVHPDERKSIKARMEERLTMQGEYKQRFEMLRMKKNGESFWGGAIVTSGQYKGRHAVIGTIIDISESKKAEEELKKSEERYKEIVEGTDDLIIKVDHNGSIVFANYMANRIFGLSQKDIIGMHISKCIHPDDKDKTRKLIDETVAKRGTSATFENRQVSQSGGIRHLFWTSNFHYDSLGNLIEVTSIARNITRRRKMEEELKKARDDLERRVKERTQELEKANEELKEKTKDLEELNTALKIFLERREKDKEENGEKILLNVKELLIPYLNKLKKSTLTENQRNYVGLLDSGLQEIISPFAQKLTSRYMHITPKELQVANLVKEGNTSKEIAEILNSTERTVVAHRANLRKKLGLKKKANLRTYLLYLK